MLTVVELVILAALSIVAAVFSTLAGMGGGIFLLATLTYILPISAVIPLSGVFILGSQLSRLYYFYPCINWSITRFFSVGAIVGAVSGSLIYSLMSDIVISLLLSVTIVAILWGPPIKTRISLPCPYLWIGAFHTWLSAITGLGGLLQGIMLRSNLSRYEILATIAASLMAMSLLKVIAYAWIGFDYQPYGLAILISLVAGFVGTWGGKRCLNLVSEKGFRLLMRVILTCFAIHLFWKSLEIY